MQQKEGRTLASARGKKQAAMRRSNANGDLYERYAEWF